MIFFLKYGAAAIIFGSAFAWSQLETARQRDVAAAKMAAADAKEKAIYAYTESLDYVFVILDSRGDVVEWNPAAEKMTGYSRDEMIGRGIEPIIPEDMRATHRAAFARAFADDAKLGKTQRVYCQVIRKDPAKKPVDVCVSVRVVKFGEEKFAWASIDRQSKIQEIDVSAQ